MSKKMSRSQIAQLTQALCLSILPVLVPALVYYALGGREIQWRLCLAGTAWAAATYTQLVAMKRKKRRLLIGSEVLYLIAAAFSFTILGPVAIAFLVLQEGLLVMLWLHRKDDQITAAHILSPAVFVFTGLVLTAGVVIIGLSL